MQNMELTSALNKAKIGLLSKTGSVFISTVLFSVKFVWSTDIETARINTKTLEFNPDFFMSLNQEERIFVLAHEPWHLCLKHAERRGSKFVKRWAKATDYVINGMLVAAGYTMPKMGLFNAKFNGMTTEEVYSKLPDEPEDYIDPQTFDNETIEKLNSILMKAATQQKASGKSAGSMPGGVQRYIDELYEPKLDWHSLLATFMMQFGKDNYTFSKPNKRFMPDFYLPTLYSEGVDKVASALDLSGSITTEMLTSFLSELDSVKTQVNPDVMEIVGFDTRVSDVHILNSDQSVKDLAFTGGGGTSLHPVFEHYQGDNSPQILIVFTDLYCSPITEDPGYAVLWIVIGNPNAEVNFGTIIHYTED